MNLTYEYESKAICDEYADEWPETLACVPRVGDCIQGTAKGFILKVMAVTLQSHHRVLITLGMDRIGHSDPVFKEVHTGQESYLVCAVCGSYAGCEHAPRNG